MVNVAYVFTVNQHRINRYKVPSSNDVEFKTIAATGLEVWAVDASSGLAVEVRIIRNDIRLGTSIVLGGNVSLEFHNTHSGPRNGYIGGVRP